MAVVKGILTIKDMPMVMLNIIEKADKFVLVIVVIPLLLINQYLH